MAGSLDFFGQRNPQAVLKHGVLTRYAYYFAGRAGKATDGKVAFIDGYAGEGRYEDGSPGSPLLLAGQASQVQALRRSVKLAFVERDPLRRRKLEESLEAHGVVADQVLGQPLEEVIDDLLARYRDHAIFLFVDPFGLAVDRSTLERILRRSSRRQPIDVLYHFSLGSVARMGRAAVVPGPTSQHNAILLDEALGPVGWREDFLAAIGAQKPTLAALQVAQKFGASIKITTGLQATAIPVRQRPRNLPLYLLMLFSANSEAHWDFADLAGSAHVDWLLHCDTEDYEANLLFDQGLGLLPLFREAPPTADEIERKIKLEAVPYLVDRLSQLLGIRRPVRPVDRIEEVYGDMLGRARATHLRTAVKVLHSDGRIDDPGTGDFWLRSLSFASN